METKKCKQCGRELPLSEFTKKHFGVAHLCKECTAKRITEAKANKKRQMDLEHELANARNLRIQDFKPRELMAELKRRGYEFRIEYTETHIIDSKDIEV